jgi:hypothetical protein
MSGSERLTGWVVTIIGVIVFGIACRCASCTEVNERVYKAEWHKSYRSCIEAGYNPAECRTP